MSNIALQVGAEQLIQEGVVKTKKRVLTKRAVIWLGQTCNLRCFFCYFLDRIENSRHAEHEFMSLEKAKKMCTVLREFYGCTAVDIQGGEPTIYPHIYELVAHCRRIGLYPTLITNCLVLGKPEVLERFQESGVRDFLCSIHGIGDVHDQVVQRQGSYAKVIQALERMKSLKVPFRFNCTMSKPVVEMIPEVARLAIHYGARAVNFIAFNPFEDQKAGKRSAENVARYSEIQPFLTQAMDILEDAGIECNVRYFPLCFAEERHRKNFYNYQQLPYDTHEWDYQSWLWTGQQAQRMHAGPLNDPFLMENYYDRTRQASQKIEQWLNKTFLSAKTMGKVYRAFVNGLGEFKDWLKLTWLGKRLVSGVGQALCRTEHVLYTKDSLYRKEGKSRAQVYQYDEKCAQCALKNICDGFHGDYFQIFGSREARPVANINMVDDSRYYIRYQSKIVEEEDKAWAL